MIRSLWSGDSGLNAHQTTMYDIRNNIANVNTYGFKASRTSFSDIYYQAKKSAPGGPTTFAGNNESAVGYGVEVSSIDKDMSTSSFQSTNRVLDVAISGDGFFITGTVDDLLNVDNVNYTRYGGFGVDSAGNLVNTLNRFVLGTINDGTYTQKEMDTKNPVQDPMELDTINVNDHIWAAFKRYTEIDYTDVPKNYKGTTNTTTNNGQTTTTTTGRTIFEGVDPYDTTKTVAYDRDLSKITNNTTGTPPVYESEKLLDDAIQLDLRNGTNNVVPTAGGSTDVVLRSDYTLYYVGGKYVNNQGVEYDPEVGAYVDEDGYYYNYEVVTHIDDQGGMTKTHTYTRLKNDPATGKPTTAAGIGTAPAATPSAAHGTNGVDGTSYNIDDAPNTVFTYNEQTKAFETQDAFDNTIFANMKMRPLSYGDLDGFSVSAGGSLVATYAGEIKVLARLELATFDNPEGLDQIGETAFAESVNSGEPRVKATGTMGA